MSGAAGTLPMMSESAAPNSTWSNAKLNEPRAAAAVKSTALGEVRTDDLVCSHYTKFYATFESSIVAHPDPPVKIRRSAEQ
jgi:hypothetical protein